MPATDRAKVMKQLTSVRGRLAAHRRRGDELNAERDRLYLVARDQLDPPITFKAIGDLFGVTEGAVMQKVERVRDEANGVVRPAKPRTREERIAAGAAGGS